MQKVNTMEKTTHTYRDLANLLQGLMSVTDLKGVKFSLQVTKNINLIKSELEHLEEAAKPSDEFQKLAMEVRAIEEENKDKTQEEIIALIKEVEDKHPELIETRKAQIDEFNKMLEEEVELSLFRVAEKSLPSDITSKQLLSINLIIKE